MTKIMSQVAQPEKNVENMANITSYVARNMSNENNIHDKNKIALP